MKAVPSLIVALILGGAAVIFNWVYLQKKASEFEVVAFLGIREDVTIRLGETLLESHFEEVPIPKRYADKLKKYVFTYRDKPTIAGIKATRDYQGGDLVHRQDYRTPARTIKLKDDERLIWVTVDSRAFVPALVNPGDQLTFVFPGPGTSGPMANDATAETLGPFTIGALGTRLGDVDVAKGHSSGRAEERQVGIIAKVESGKLEAKAVRLLELTTGANRSIAVALHPKKQAD